MPITDADSLDQTAVDPPQPLTVAPMQPVQLDDTGTPFVPGAPTVSPALVPAAPAPPVADPSKVSVGGSFQGITDRGIAMSQKARGPVDQRIAGRVAQADAAMGPAEAQLSQAQTEASRAAKSEGDINAEHFQRQLQIDRTQQAMFNDFANAEKMRQATVAADREHYLGQYEQQLAAVRTLTAQSGNPLQSLSGSQAAGLSLAAFAQGFLAPAGVHIDVTGQIDRWVERSMQEHQMAIQNARQNAGDTLNLYQLARQSSQDDYEAAQRYRGFVIEGLKAGVQAEASRWGSQAAVAAAQDKVAQLDVAAAQSKVQLGQYRQGLIDAVTQQEYTKAHNQAMEGIEGMKAQADLIRAQAQANKQQAPDLTVTSPFDTNDKGQRRIIGRVKPGLPNDVTTAAYNKISAANADASNLHAQIDTVKSLYNQIGRVDSKWWEDKSSPEYRRFENASNLLSYAILHPLTGSAMTDNEREMGMKFSQPDQLIQDLAGKVSGQGGGNGALFDDLDKYASNRLNSAINDPAIERATGTAYDESSGIDTNPAGTALVKARDVGTAPEATLTQKAYDGATSTSSNATNYASSMSGAWSVYNGGKTEGEPRWAVYMDQLAADVAAGKLKNGMQDPSVQEAHVALVRMMAGEASVPQDRRQYAKALIESIEYHPEVLSKDLSTDVQPGQSYLGSHPALQANGDNGGVTYAVPSDAGIGDE